MEQRQVKKGGRVILHVDMNSFYASVEMAHNPELKGKPLAIAGNAKERRGIIVTCSYAARKHGVKTTMPIWQAQKLCPGLILMEPNFDRYRAASQGIFDLLRMYTPLVEPVSIDEGYLDITDYCGDNSPVEIAQTIQKRIMETMDLPCSIGIAPNKFLAKTASDMKKPMGITILRKREVQAKLWHLPVGEMHGVGQKTAEKLSSINIKTIGDLANAHEVSLKKLLGINGVRLRERANGIDRRVVDPESIYDFKSVGNSTTLPRDVTNQQELFEVLHRLSEKVSARLKKKELLTIKVQIMIRYKDRKTVTRGKTLQNPIHKAEDLYSHARDLFSKHWNGNPVRLLGVTANEVVEQQEAIKQLDIFSFDQDEKEVKLDTTVEKLTKKFGDKIIRKGIEIDNNKVDANTSFSKDFLKRPKPRNDKGN
ncbi:DNA polymerase IV [Bacillus sp. E214]|jgi:DNA polymerase-4|uniref:DNA polymerase IV n=1 Tax=Bacillus sp. E214 TaxID=2587156 RepID=UPI0011DF9412|nr:DNA polymerase IV [Bacillus sp. E214]